MSDHYGYPLNDKEFDFNESITTEFHEKTFAETKQNKLEFEVDGNDYTFIPDYYPDRVSVTKERDLVREKGICRNEYVKDVGTKNREIHVVGMVTTDNLQDFHDMCDFGQRADLITMQWRGEVLLKKAELDGPEGVDVDTGHYLYKYTLDFVSTGRDELGLATTGVIDDGSGNNRDDRDGTNATGGFVV